MQKLMIVCGLPGTGKTTLARALSSRLNIACLSKDSIKEGLYDIRKCSTLEESIELGQESIQQLFKLAQEQLENGVDLILEAPFHYEEDYPLFKQWQDRYNVEIYSIVCSVDPKVRAERFRKRERHAGHHDDERLVNVDMPMDAYDKLPGTILNIQTKGPVEELVKIILDTVEKI